MGQIRLKVGPVPETTKDIPLPGHWDELDSEEKSAFVAETASAFFSAVAPVAVEVTE